MGVHRYSADFRAEDDVVADHLERRWFASMTAVRAKQAQCEVLMEMVATMKASWRESRAELHRLEALRDALADAVCGPVAERSALCQSFASGAEGSEAGRFGAERPGAERPEAEDEAPAGRIQRETSAGKSRNASRTRRAAST